MILKTLLASLEERRGLTAERPGFLEADALARYSFAKKYCKEKEVLDVGTGFGTGARFIAEGGASKVLGIDYDARIIQRISKSNRVKNLSFKYMNALELWRIDEKFDVILAFEIIEHLPVERVREFIVFLYEHLREGGFLILSTPNGLKTEYLLGTLYNPYHIKEYKEEEIRDLLLEYFPKVEIKGYKTVNKDYIKKNSKITRSFFHKIAYLLGHFRIAREFLAFIPLRIKHLVTKENTLPTLTKKDYVFIDEVIDCPGLLAIARREPDKKNLYPSLSIITPNYNGENYLKNCLDSVLASGYTDFEVIVCDDNSSDESWNILKDYKDKDRRIRLIRNKKNLGASASRNKAAAEALGEIIVFLDNDTVVDKDSLSNLARPFLNDSTIAAAQATLLDLEKKDLVQHAGGVLAPQVGWLIPFFQWERYSLIKKKIFEKNIIAVSAALAVRKDVFNLVGGFDEAESLHTEDIDFCWRIWIAGRKIVLADKAVVYHLSKSVENRTHMGSNNFKIYFHLAKNSFRSLIKNYELINILRFLPQSLFINLFRGFLVLIRRGDISALSATISAVFWNFIHIPDTMRERRKVQKTRHFSDEYIMGEVFDKSGLLQIYNQNFRQTKLLW